MKRRLQRQRRKEKKKAEQSGFSKPTKEETPDTKVADNGKSPDMKEAKKGKGAKELKLTSMNESASKKRRPFDYDDEKSKSPEKLFSLKALDPE